MNLELTWQFSTEMERGGWSVPGLDKVVEAGSLTAAALMPLRWTKDDFRVVIYVNIVNVADSRRLTVDNLCL